MDWNKLSPAVPRTFVSSDADLKDKDTVVAWYQALLDRQVASAKELEQWIRDRSELDAALGQTGSILYISMTCATDDETRAAAYRQFIEVIDPAVKPLAHALNQRFLSLAERFLFNDKRFDVYRRSAKADVDLFVEKNIPLQTEVALLAQEYQMVSGAMTVTFKGVEQTLPEMGKYLQETDRVLREQAWRAVAARRLQDRAAIETIFDKMRALRSTIATQAGCDNFRDYMFRGYHRFDYTPEDCKAYHRTVKELVVPLRREIDQRRKKDMKLDILRPWDTAVDPQGRPPLKPFDQVRRLVEGTGRIVQHIDPSLGEMFSEMDRLGLLDLESRKGKAPGGYQNTLDESRRPFIFMNAVGIDDDVRTLLHESGHAFHANLSAADPIVDYRHAPMEISEVASMSMELMGDRYINEFYAPEDARRSSLEFLEGVVSILPWVAVVDSFQHWMYENPSHTPEQRRDVWCRINTEFGGGVVDWTGLEDERAFLWHRQLHIFEVPFYYIEYGIAQLGALQIWRQYRQDPLAAVANYKKGLSLGGSRPLPELFAAAGISFDFSRDMIAPLIDDVYKAWKKAAGDS